jgi:hypothetical protein
MEERAFEYDGIAAVGDLPVVIRRDSAVEHDHSVAMATGRREALSEVLGYVESRLAQAGAYDDTRPLSDMVVYLADMIRAT